MSVREQERRQKEAERRMDKEMRRADKETRREIEARAGAADKRMRQVIRRIEKGDVEPRPLPGVREDSMESKETCRRMPKAKWTRCHRRCTKTEGIAH